MSFMPHAHAREKRSQLRGARRGAAKVTSRYCIGGNYYTVQELAEHFGLPADTMYRRIRRLLGSGQPITLDALAASGGRG